MLTVISVVIYISICAFIFYKERKFPTIEDLMLVFVGVMLLVLVSNFGNINDALMNFNKE